MRYRTLSASGDYTFGLGPNGFLVNSPQAVAQAVLTGLLLHQGEWFLNTQVGMPWETSVIGYNTQSLYDSAIKNYTISVQGVSSIVSYNSSLGTNRVLSVAVVINTIYGNVKVNTQFSVGGFGIGPFGFTPFGDG